MSHNGHAGGVSRARYITSFALLVFLCAFIGYCYGIRGMRTFLVPSESMVPTLIKHDYIVTIKEREYHRGDIVVLRDPKAPDSFIVKRITGLPGDTVAVDGGALFLNGEYASEPYIFEPMQQPFALLEIPERQVFVMGDNRNDSEDSTVWGYGVPIDTIIGRVIYIYSPMSRMGRVASYPLTNADGV